MKGIHDRVATGPLACIARREEDEHIAIGGVALQVALERLPVNRDPLDGRRAGAGHDVRHGGLDLADGDGPQHEH